MKKRSARYEKKSRRDSRIVRRLDFPRADQLFQMAFHCSPTLRRIYAYFGARFQLEGRYSEAETAYRQALEFERDSTTTMGLEETLERLRLPQPSGTPVPSDGS